MSCSGGEMSLYALDHSDPGSDNFIGHRCDTTAERDRRGYVMSVSRGLGSGECDGLMSIRKVPEEMCKGVWSIETSSVWRLWAIAYLPPFRDSDGASPQRLWRLKASDKSSSA